MTEVTQHSRLPVGAPKRTLRVRIAAHTALNFKLRAKAACCGTLYGPRVIINRNHETVAVDVEPIWTQAIVYFNDLTAVEFHVRDDIAEAVVLHVLKELLGSEAKFHHGLHLVAPALRADAFLGMGFPGFPDKAVHKAMSVIDEVIDAADWRRNQPGTPIFRIGRPGPGEPFWLPFAGKPIAIV